MSPDIQIGCVPGDITIGMLLSLPVVLTGIALIGWAHGERDPATLVSVYTPFPAAPVSVWPI